MKKSYLAYIIPSIIVSIFGGIYTIVDGIFIGQVIGDDGLTAINIAWPITAFVQSVGLAIGVATGILMSTYEGKKEELKQSQTQFIGMILLLVISIVLGVVLFIFHKPLLVLFGAKEDVIFNYASDYLKIILCGAIFQVGGMGLAPIIRNKGKVKLVMIAMLIGTSVNIIGDYLFIYHLGLGLSGAAITSVLGLAVSAIICFIYLLISKSIAIHRLNKAIIGKIFKISLSPLVLSYSPSILIIITNLICLNLGGVECVATYTIYSYIIYVFQSSSQGSGDGVQPLISYYFGADEQEKLKSTKVKAYLFTICFTFVLLILVIICKDAIPHLFGTSNEATRLYNDGFVYFAIGLVFISLVKVNCCYLYAQQQTIKANILVLLEPLFVTPLLLIILSQAIGINGIWLSYSLAQMIIAVLGIVFLLFSKKNNLKIID